jgi:flavin reductase (DIM6/NTAB) family NADH-FMN oxidoreductase RutF
VIAETFEEMKMSKVEVTTRSIIPVRPILIVGANVEYKADFVAIGAGGMLSEDPPTVAIPFRHMRYSLKGTLENRTFSVNIPSIDMVKEADYCGLVSGKDNDKVQDCRFKVFYGKLKTAPMIEQFPINFECKLLHMIGTVTHAVVIGQVVGTYISGEYLKEGKLDTDKFVQLLWYKDSGQYVAAGKPVGQAFSIGHRIKS